MDVSHILDGLNDAQREAVTAAPGPMLVLAGAGSGKTRVLVHRMAWLIQVEGISPFSIMAVTFTNKAAAEMRGRVELLQGVSPNGMWWAHSMVLHTAYYVHTGKKPIYHSSFRFLIPMTSTA